MFDAPLSGHCVCPLTRSQRHETEAHDFSRELLTAILELFDDRINLVDSVLIGFVDRCAECRGFLVGEGPDEIEQRRTPNETVDGF